MLFGFVEVKLDILFSRLKNRRVEW